MKLNSIDLKIKLNEFLDTNQIVGIIVSAKKSQPYYYKGCNLRIGRMKNERNYLAFYPPSCKGVKEKSYPYIQLFKDGNVHIGLHFYKYKKYNLSNKEKIFEMINRILLNI